MARIKGGAARKRRDSANLIEDPAKRLVAFSKHRPTLFTMAGNLSALCGVDTAVVVFSQSGKVYAFGSPSVDAVLRRYQPLVHVNDYLDGATAVAEEGGNGGASLAALRQELDDTKARVDDDLQTTAALFKLRSRSLMPSLSFSIEYIRYSFMKLHIIGLNN
jgi:hypothetical protein